MPVKITYKKTNFKKQQANLVLFTNEKFSTTNLKKYLSISEFSYINDLLKTSDKKKICLFLRSDQKK